MGESPFLQHMSDIFSSLKGRSLWIVGVIWLVVLGVALSCAFGLFSFDPPANPAETQVPATVTPLATALVVDNATPDTIVLPTPTPGESIPVPPVSNLDPLPWGDFGYGIAAHGIGMPYYTMKQVKGHLGLNWVKQQVRWDHFSAEPGMMDWSGYDAMVDAAAEQGLNVMLSVVGAPEWSYVYRDSNPQASPPDDFELYVSFLTEMVDRYKGRIHAIEVWNEQNLDREWDTAEGVNAARYVELLRMAYQAIKSHDPNIVVISGALSPTGAIFTDPENADRYTVVDDFLFFQQMIDAGLLSYVDCVGAHHNGINMPPNVAWDEGYNDPNATYRGPFDSPNHSWSFKSTLWGYHDMIVAAGFSTPLCITEFGWATAEGFEGTPPQFEFADDNTLAEQSEWDMLAFKLMREWGFVHLAFLWNLDYSYKGGLGPTDPNAPYSILDMEGAPRQAFTAIGEMPKIP